MGKTIVLENVRISYPKLYKAERINSEGKPKFSCALIIPNDHPQLQLLKGLAKAEVDKEWPDGAPITSKSWKDMPLVAGEEYQEGKFKNSPDYKYHHVLNTSKNEDQGRPPVVDQNRTEVLDPGKVYPGMYVNAAISVFAYNKKLYKGVTTGLEAIQIVSDGDRLDNRPSVDELFKPIDVQEDDYDPLS